MGYPVLECAAAAPTHFLLCHHVLLKVPDARRCPSPAALTGHKFQRVPRQAGRSSVGNDGVERCKFQAELKGPVPSIGGVGGGVVVPRPV